MAIGFRFEDRFGCYVNAESVNQFSININFGMPAKTTVVLLCVKSETSVINF